MALKIQLTGVRKGIDGIGLWAGLTVFFGGLAWMLPTWSNVFSVKVTTVPFCVLLTQLVDRVDATMLRRFWPDLAEKSVDFMRTTLLLLPFALLFSVFAIRDGSTFTEAVSVFSYRFGLCLLVVPATFLLVRLIANLCSIPRQRASRRSQARHKRHEEGGSNSRKSFSRIARG